MATLLRKEKRAIYLRKIRGFWEEFSHNKIGLTGLVLLCVYIGVAIFAPWLTPYDPVKPPQVAGSFAMPDWVTILPQYKDLPRTMNKTLYWNVQEGSEFVRVEGWGEEAVLRFIGGTTERTEVILSASFSYPYKVATSKFYTKFRWIVEETNAAEYAFDLIMVNTTGGQFKFWVEPTSSINRELTIYLESTQVDVLRILGIDPSKQVATLAEMIFKQPGEYKLLLRIYFTPTPGSVTANCKVTVKDAHIFLPGRVHGILGANYLGNDVYTELVYGSRISLAIGLLAAVIAVVFGTLVGVAAGYMGGAFDEIAMRAVDVMMAIPTLPILLAFIYIFGPNVFYIIVLIAIFGWQGLSRIVRSQVLSLKETAFVECAVASGAGRGYIMIRHMIPNVFPIIISSFILRVPGAILSEASLSFLGFSDPRAPTWGRMLNLAFSYGAFMKLAWWWIFPPGLAITFLCLAFVFMGHAVDEIINPRLRRRR